MPRPSKPALGLRLATVAAATVAGTVLSTAAPAGAATTACTAGTFTYGELVTALGASGDLFTCTVSNAKVSIDYLDFTTGFSTGTPSRTFQTTDRFKWLNPLTGTHILQFVPTAPGGIVNAGATATPIKLTYNVDALGSFALNEYAVNMDGAIGNGGRSGTRSHSLTTSNPLNGSGTTTVSNLAPAIIDSNTGPLNFAASLFSVKMVSTTYADSNAIVSVSDQFFQGEAPVPGPLPLLGAGAAFGFSRKLRKRIKAAA